MGNLVLHFQVFDRVNKNSPLKLEFIRWFNGQLQLYLIIPSLWDDQSFEIYCGRALTQYHDENI